MSNEQNVEATVNGAIKNMGGFDVMVNNAGMMIFKKIEDQTADDWIKILSVDLLGAFFFTKQSFSKMKNGGAIVNVSSNMPLRQRRMLQLMCKVCFAFAYTLCRG